MAIKRNVKSSSKKTTSKATTASKEDIPENNEVKSSAEKRELAALVASLNKKFGDNAVSLGVPREDDGSVRAIKRIPTGSVALDMALGGGIPIGRYTEINGGLSTTKTTQSILILKKAQEMGMTCAFIDVEATTDETYLKSLGIDVENLIYSRPSGMEEATQMVLDLQTSGLCNLALIDSIAALSPTKEQSKGMDEAVQMGLAPRLLGEFFRKYQANNNRLEREGNPVFTLVGINQLREKIGAYGDPEYSPGGRAKGFTQSVEVSLRKGDWIIEGKGNDRRIVGQVVKFKIGKNKTFKRMQTGEFDFYFDTNSAGVPKNSNDNFKSIITLGVFYGLIEQKGAWFFYGDNKYQGLNALISQFRDSEEVYLGLYDEVKQRTLQNNGG